MTMVATTGGDVEAGDLGATLVHEHLRCRREMVVTQFPFLYDEDAEFKRAVEAVAGAHRHGIATICDPTVMGLGRDVHFAAKVAAACDVNLVVATGAYVFDTLPGYFQGRSADEFADALAHDLTVGVQGTGIRAGFLKCATDAPGLTADVEKILRAVARAHAQTGAAIMTHTSAIHESGRAQVLVFEDEGVDMHRVMIGHCGDSSDMRYLRTVLAHGCFIGLDRFGYRRGPTMDMRIDVLIKLLEEGFGRQLCISHDLPCTSDRLATPEMRRAELEEDSLTYIFTRVIPEMRQRGIADATIDELLIANPRRWLTGA